MFAFTSMSSPGLGRYPSTSTPRRVSAWRERSGASDTPAVGTCSNACRRYPRPRASEYPAAPKSTVTSTRSSELKPSGIAYAFTMPRANTPAMTRRKTAAAACIAVRALRNPASENLPRRSLGRVAYNAGRIPTARPTPEDRTREATSSREPSSRSSCTGKGRFRSSSGTNLMATDAAATPRHPPTRPRPRLSTTTCRTSLDRLAPSACRIDISRRRTDASASRRPEILAQTMSRRVPTNPVSTASLPTTAPDAVGGRRAASLTVKARGRPERPVHSSGYD